MHLILTRLLGLVSLHVPVETPDINVASSNPFPREAHTEQENCQINEGQSSNRCHTDHNTYNDHIIPKQLFPALKCTRRDGDGRCYCPSRCIGDIALDVGEQGLLAAIITERWGPSIQVRTMSHSGHFKTESFLARVMCVAVVHNYIHTDFIIVWTVFVPWAQQCRRYCSCWSQ